MGAGKLFSSSLPIVPSINGSLQQLTKVQALQKPQGQMRRGQANMCELPTARGDLRLQYKAQLGWQGKEEA
jgi:hypothetical protein